LAVGEKGWKETATIAKVIEHHIMKEIQHLNPESVGNDNKYTKQCQNISTVMLVAILTSTQSIHEYLNQLQQHSL
jgi:hypothetical protein